jgi:EAL domain-containing protein (putative c-di-GMP-specific phosphodiesterase class I)
MTQNLLMRLCRAIDQGEIVPYFQPLVELRSGHLAGFEVLARWLHPERGMVPPDEFIPGAEAAGLIGPVTEAVLSQALAAMAAIDSRITLSVNISATQLLDNALPGMIEDLARAHAFPLHRLMIEVTEGALIGNLKKASAVAHALKDLGMHIALDDFGTGYSSLAALR